jgi:hypothetical protein
LNLRVKFFQKSLKFGQLPWTFEFLSKPFKISHEYKCSSNAEKFKNFGGKFSNGNRLLSFNKEDSNAGCISPRGNEILKFILKLAENGILQNRKLFTPITKF